MVSSKIELAEMLAAAAERRHWEADLLWLAAGFMIGIVIGAGIGSFGLLGAVMSLRFGGF